MCPAGACGTTLAGRLGNERELLQRGLQFGLRDLKIGD